VRELAGVLAEELPDALATYTNLLVEGRFAFLEGTADSGHTRVRDGADLPSSLRTAGSWPRPSTTQSSRSETP